MTVDPSRGRRLGARLLAGLVLAALGAAAVGGCGSEEGGSASTPGASSSSTGGSHAAKGTAGVPRSFFGVIPQTALTGADLDRMGDGDVGTLKPVIPWSALDPTRKPGDLNLESIDGIVLGAAHNGIDVLPTIYSTPDWVARDLDGYECGDECAVYAPRSGAAVRAWTQFLGELADRYGPDGSLWADNPDVDPRPIRTWQIWNEQNSPSFYRPKPDVGAYADLVSASAETIRKRDPDATIVLGGMFGTPFDGKPPAYTAWDFLRQLYAVPGAAGDFDGVGVHPYAAHMRKVESQTRLVHDEIERAGDDATMWITEIGWASSGPTVPLNRGPRGQAEDLTKAFDFFLAKRVEWRIENVDWYSWSDSAEPVCDWCGGSGLFEKTDLVPKRSWYAYVAFTGGS